MKKLFYKRMLSSIIIAALTISLLSPAKSDVYAQTLDNDTFNLEADSVFEAEEGELQVAADEEELAIVGEDITARSLYAKDFMLERNMHTNLPQTRQEANSLNWKNSEAISEKNPNGGGPPAKLHQYSATNGENVKYVSPDGHKEIIFNSQGEIVLDARDIGTYNIIPYKGDVGTWIGHGLFDVVPWALFGNSDDDPGPVGNWIISLFE